MAAKKNRPPRGEGEPALDFVQARKLNASKNSRFDSAWPAPRTEWPQAEAASAAWGKR